MSTKDIRNIAVIGAGLMGHSIAQEFAVSGYRVSLNDVSEERLDHARERIRQNLEMLGRSDEWDGVASRITFTGDLRTAVEGADLVIEAITENLEIKRELFAELESICRADTILASNTSTFMPSQLAEATQNPGRVIVMHYFNPPHVVPLVEVVGGRDTSPETVETVRDLLVSQGKKPVVLEKEVRWASSPTGSRPLCCASASRSWKTASRDRRTSTPWSQAALVAGSEWRGHLKCSTPPERTCGTRSANSSCPISSLPPRCLPRLRGCPRAETSA